MNAGLIILRVASEKRDAHNERDGARAAQLRRNGDSVAPATPSSVPPSQQHYNLQPSTQLVVFVASVLEVLPAAPRGGTRR